MRIMTTPIYKMSQRRGYPYNFYWGKIVEDRGKMDGINYAVLFEARLIF